MSITSRFWISIRNRDWGTAIIDVAVVAIGIVMALAVDDWRSGLERDAKEMEALLRAHEQVVLIQRMVVAESNFNLAVLDDLYEVRRLAFNIPPDRPISGEECRSLVNAYGGLLPGYNISGIEELVTSEGGSLEAGSAVRILAIDVLDSVRYTSDVAKAFSPALINFTRAYPDLVSLKMLSTDSPDDRDGLVPSAECDLNGMRRSRGFQADLNQNINLMIAIVEVGQGATIRHLSSLHDALDTRLELEHP